MIKLLLLSFMILLGILGLIFAFYTGFILNKQNEELNKKYQW